MVKGRPRLAVGMVLLAAAFAVASCSRSPKSTQTSEPSFWVEGPPPVGFVLADTLVCRTTTATHSAFLKRTFKIVGARGPRPWIGGASPKGMPVLQESGTRAVFQLAGEDPGSVDTVSLDRGNGEFVRQFSGWDPHGRLAAGAERGYCQAQHAQPGDRD